MLALNWYECPDIFDMEIIKKWGVPSAYLIDMKFTILLNSEDDSTAPLNGVSDRADRSFAGGYPWVIISRIKTYLQQERSND